MGSSFLNKDMVCFDLESIIATESRIRFGNTMNESMDYIVNRLNYKGLCLNLVWVRGVLDHVTKSKSCDDLL